MPRRFYLGSGKSIAFGRQNVIPSQAKLSSVNLRTYEGSSPPKKSL